MKPSQAATSVDEGRKYAIGGQHTGASRNLSSVLFLNQLSALN